MNIKIQRANSNHAKIIVSLLSELLQEIIDSTEENLFQLDEAELISLAQNYLGNEQYVVFLAEETTQNTMVGFISLYEGRALYAGGNFGVIPELFVQSPFRSNNIGRTLLDAAKKYGSSKEWKALEVTTPPLPYFERTLRFYDHHGFSIAGGRKMKFSL